MLAAVAHRKQVGQPDQQRRRACNQHVGAESGRPVLHLPLEADHAAQHHRVGGGGEHGQLRGPVVEDLFHEASVRAASSRLRHGRLTATRGRCARSTAIVPICTTPVGAHWGATGFTGKACRAPVRSYEAATSRTRAKLRLPTCSTPSTPGAKLVPASSTTAPSTDRKSVVSGKSVSVRVALGGSRINKNKKKKKKIIQQ